MLKWFKIVGGILFGVVLVEAALAFYKAPIGSSEAMLSMFMVIIFSAVGMLALGFMSFLVYQLLSNQRHERETNLEQSRMLHAGYQISINTLGYISQKQIVLMDKMIEKGGELHQLKSGGYAMVVEGQVLPVSDEQAKYYLEAPM